MRLAGSALVVVVCLMLPAAARAAVGDPLRCGQVRDTFNRANSTDPGPLWTESVADMQIIGNKATSPDTGSTHPLMTYVGSPPSTKAVCVDIFGGDGTPGAYVNVALQQAVASNARVVRLEDSQAPFDGNFDHLSFLNGNVGVLVDEATISPAIATGTLEVRRREAGAGTAYDVAVDRTFDGNADFAASATFTELTVGTQIALGAFGGATLDNFSTPSATPGLSLGMQTTYTEQEAPVPVVPNATVADADDANLEGATIRILPGAASDVLSFTNTAQITGTAVGTSELRLSGTATLAQYRDALRSVAYANTSDAPPQTRHFFFTVSDGDSDSDDAESIVLIDRVNDQPAVAASGTPLTYPENGAPAPVDPALTISDPDASTLTGATMEITGGRQPGDTLSFTAANGITASFADGKLTLTGTAPFATYEAALRSVTFASTDDNPTADRTVEVRVADGALGSPPATRTVTIAPVNDAAVLTTSTTPLGYQQDDPAVVADAGVTVADVDDTLLEGATVSTDGVAPGDTLTFTNQNGISGLAAGGLLTLSGTATLAQYEAALRSVRFATARTDTPRTVSFSVNDGDVSSAGATRTLAIAPAAEATPTPSPTPGATPTVALKLSDVSVAHKRLKHGHAQIVRFTLNAPARLALVLTHKRKRVSVQRSYDAAGSYAVRVKGRKLGVGKWRLTATATATGQAPSAVKRRFRVRA